MNYSLKNKIKEEPRNFNLALVSQNYFQQNIPQII